MKILLIDGNNLIFRAYFGTAYMKNPLKTSDGFPTNALYAFMRTLKRIEKEEEPDGVLIAFDKGKTFRHKMYDSYKDGRDETPSDLKKQLPLARDLARFMGYFVVELDGYEADDIIGTYANLIAKDEGTEATIVSSDKDLLQLISKNIKVKLLKSKDHILFDEKRLKEEMGITPSQIIDLKALMGDPSDNIPGVKGVGEKTALKLIKEYRSLDKVYENIENFKGKLKENLINDKDNAYISYELAKIVKDVPIDTNLNQLKFDGALQENLENLYKQLEFKVEVEKVAEEESIDVKIIKDMSVLSDSPFSYYVEVFQDEVLGIAIYQDEKSYFVEAKHIDLKVLKKNISKITYDLKKNRRYLNISGEQTDDLYLGLYLNSEDVSEDLAYYIKNQGRSILLDDELYGKTVKRMPEFLKVIKNASLKAKFIYEYRDFNKTNLYQDLELPLTFVLSEMEKEGIKVDEQELERFGNKLNLEIEQLENYIIDRAGKNFNINSFKQLGKVLFEDLKITYPKKLKNNNYSTDAQTLIKVVDEDPIVRKVLEYRHLTKLRGTYVEGLKPFIKDSRIHTVFNQALTRTGRLSSSNPNLQNIPVRNELTRSIRKIFVADEGYTFLSSDYSQIELRVFADIANLEGMIEAFKKGQDIHRKTAADIFKKDISEVTPDERSKAKAVNFGIIYGISSFGLSEDLNMTMKEAKSFIKDYKDTYPEIEKYFEKEIKLVKEKGYVETILKRKRRIPEIYNSNLMVRKQGERMALNTPIQGSAADIIKLAMINLDKTLKKENLESKIILQIHDELILKVKNDELEKVKKIVKKEMEGAYQLKVPLLVDIKTGQNWYEL